MYVYIDWVMQLSSSDYIAIYIYWYLYIFSVKCLQIEFKIDLYQVIDFLYFTPSQYKKVNLKFIFLIFVLEL